ncbi:MAG: phosphoserine phosphatase SerB [Halobacteriovorax sp.]|nr:phosphoserine phosphatase SerB [Halobacteriovorax sp.]
MQKTSSNRNILVTVSGPDQPGITSKLMHLVTEHGAILKDMGQAVTHGLLSLSFLIEVGGDEPRVVKELLFSCSQMNLTLTFQDVEMRDLPDVGEKFILSCVSTGNLPASFVRDVADAVAEAGINILRIDNMTPKNFTCLEITTTVPKGLNWKKVKEKLLEISTDHQVDVAFIKDNVFRRSKRLIVFDMDSTLIQTEVIDEMADVAGVGSEVRHITEEAMNGKMDFNESLRKRVSKLKGLKVEQMQEILERLPFTPGAVEFIQTVKSLGYKVALISGGFTFFAEALKEKLGLDYAFANELEISDGMLTGEIEGTIVNAEQKAFLLKVIAQQEKISLEQVVAIGDGANDLPMLAAAGLGIAFHAKDIVKKEAEQHMSHGPMTSILYFLGIPGPGQHR